jgi:hypothetical protein
MDNDFYPTESIPNGLRDGDTAFGSRKISGNKVDMLSERTGFPACRRQNLDTRFPKRRNDRLPEALRSARDQRAMTFYVETVGHQIISKRTIMAPDREKT